MSTEDKRLDRKELIKGISLFANLSAEEVQRVADLSDEAEFGAGSVIVDQGDPGTVCHVIVEGQASVYVRGEYVTTSGPGSMIGEMALVDFRPRTATVMADTSLRTLEFESEAFRTLLEEMPKASEPILRTLRSRLDRLSEL
ncbi:MAG TPA: cyclic nucleotide-binding domain-containing protein [Microthrixaceae bacterium]|nr:cyclic nucleotide-binding domain-containing protein [Microthrixaceae bacterium]